MLEQGFPYFAVDPGLVAGALDWVSEPPPFAKVHSVKSNEDVPEPPTFVAPGVVVSMKKPYFPCGAVRH